MKSRAFFPRKILFFGGALGLGLTCLGLEPALPKSIVAMQRSKGREVATAA